MVIVFDTLLILDKKVYDNTVVGWQSCYDFVEFAASVIHFFYQEIWMSRASQRMILHNLWIDFYGSGIIYLF